MKYNRECAYCGNKYYVCNNCTEKGSWKTVCCSRECFRKLCISNKDIIAKKFGDNKFMNTIMRITLNNNIIVDIVGYDLELGKFDSKDGTTYEFNDIKSFIIPSDEMQDISKRLSDKLETKFDK